MLLSEKSAATMASYDLIHWGVLVHALLLAAHIDITYIS